MSNVIKAIKKAVVNFHFRKEVACVLMLNLMLPNLAGAAAASPVVSPVTGGNGVPVIFGHTSFDLASVGYSRAEFFIEGTAYSYLPNAALTNDGKWSVSPSSQAGYKTRLLVNRPAKDSDFNGTVIVEWINVTGTVDATPGWMQMHDELIRRGYVWIGVSAQAVGANALKLPPPYGDVARYGSITHPGDSFSYDMFSQAGQAIRDNSATILTGLKPKRIIAFGESQSASRLTTYIDAAHPLVKVYDGFLVHSRIFPNGADLSQAPLTSVVTPTPTLIRTDLKTPVLVFNTETDTGGFVARQPDTNKYRLWEVAGTAHYDLYGLRLGATDIGDRQGVQNWFDNLLNPPAQPSPNHTCTFPVNNGPQTYVMRAALSHLNRWVAYGVLPPTAPRLEVTSLQPLQFAVDAYGNAKGGIRTPAVDAAVSKLAGIGNTGTQSCFLFGQTVPFTQEQLVARYGTHNKFALKWAEATASATLKGFLLPEDAVNIGAVGVQSNVLQ